MAASRVLSFMASENTAVYQGQLEGTHLIDNQRKLSFSMHNAGGFIFLLSLREPFCVLLAALRLLGRVTPRNFPE